MAKVLLVDDDPLYRRMFLHTLEDAGHEVVEAEDGDAALAQLNNFTPALVVLDIMLPKVNGLEVLQQMHDRPELKDVPVIMTTSLQEVEMVNKALAEGAKAYLIKGDMDPDDLTKEIKKYLPPAPAKADEPTPPAP